MKVGQLKLRRVAFRAWLLLRRDVIVGRFTLFVLWTARSLVNL
jgi:hypothetical protein